MPDAWVEQALKVSERNHRLQEREAEVKRLLRLCNLEDFDDVRRTVTLLCELFNLEKV